MSGDFKKMLADARLPERTVPVCLRGDLTAAFEDLERELAEAQHNPTPSFEEASGPGAIAERMEDLRAQMREHTYTFRLRALTRRQYRDLKGKHPPRREESGEIRPEDIRLDADIDGFGEALVRACLVDPELDDETWTATVDKLTDRQYGELVGTAILVNQGGVDVPFSHAALSLLRSSGSE